jgi:hypothetical protein
MVRVRARRGPAPGSACKTKRVPTPVYCQEFLGEQLKDWVMKQGCEKAFDLGEYRVIPTSNAARGACLLKLKPLIEMLLAVTPFALIKYSDLKSHLSKLLLIYPGLKKKQETPEQWCCTTATQLNVILAHMRRLTDEKKFLQCTQCMVEADASELQLLVDLIEPLPNSPAKAQQETSVPAAQSPSASSCPASPVVQLPAKAAASEAYT